MTILTMLKRTTALAAIAALPLAPAAVLAESAQATGTQPPAAEAQAQQDQVAQQTGQQAGQQTGQQAAEAEKDPANETGIVTEGKEGTQSGETPDQARTNDQAGQGQIAPQGQAGQQAADEKDPANEAGIVTEGKEGTQSGEAPDQAGQGQTSAQGQSGQTSTDVQAGQQGTADQQGTAGQQGAAAGDQAAAGQDEDALIAKVGDREIRRSDVLSVIGMLPPQLQQQPPETLIPIALDQLVMRELILQKATEEGIGSDPAVGALDAGASERDKEDAMVQAFLDRELGDAVTEEKVQETYDTVKQQMGAQAPDVETLRPQIEQELRQQAFLDLSRDLQQDAEITLYGPDGQEVTQ